MGLKIPALQSIRYVVSDGVDDHIDTGIPADTITEVECFGKFIEGGNNLFGAYIVPDRFYISSTNEKETAFGYKSSSFGVTPLGSVFDGAVDHHFTFTSSGLLYTDGVLDIDKSGVSGSLPTANFFIFAANADGTPTGHHIAKWRYIKITHSGGVMNLVPHPTDSTAMLDTVTGTSYTNDGTGDLTAEVVTPINTDVLGNPLSNPGGYTCNGSEVSTTSRQR